MLVFSNCKINIGLHVTEKRADGYHNIETIFYPVNWCDILEIVPSTSITGKGIYFESSGNIIPGNPSENLCLKAIELLRKDFDIPGLEIYLHKLLPMGAGLGGGSSNGAFTIRLLNKLFNLNLDKTAEKHYASQLGSDCSFFIENTPCFAQGKGEILAPISLNLNQYYILLVKPNIHVSTAEAYAAIKPKKADYSLKELSITTINEWKQFVVNDFEPVVLEKYPLIEALKSTMYQNGAVYASMSGSGASVYGIFNTQPSLHLFANKGTVWAGKLSLSQ